MAEGANVEDVGFGEDYELLAAVEETGRRSLQIGRCEEGEGVEIRPRGAARTPHWLGPLLRQRRRLALSARSAARLWARCWRSSSGGCSGRSCSSASITLDHVRHLHDPPADRTSAGSRRPRRSSTPNLQTAVRPQKPVAARAVRDLPPARRPPRATSASRSASRSRCGTIILTVTAGHGSRSCSGARSCGCMLALHDRVPLGVTPALAPRQGADGLRS